LIDQIKIYANLTAFISFSALTDSRLCQLHHGKLFQFSGLSRLQQLHHAAIASYRDNFSNNPLTVTLEIQQPSFIDEFRL